MKILVIGKRFYTNRDLIADRFGRQFHLPRIWAETNDVEVIAFDYYTREPASMTTAACAYHTVNIWGQPWPILSAYLQCKQAAKQFQPDVILSSGDVVTGLIGHRLARETNAAWIYDVYDDYRHFALNRYTGLSHLLPWLCRRANGLITASADLRRLYDAWNSNVMVAENGYDPTLFSPSDKLISRQHLRLDKDYKLLVFTGSIDERFDSALVSKAMDTLYCQDDSYRLLHAGATTPSSRLSGKWLISLGSVSQSTVLEVIRSADICIAPYASSPLSEACSPCKIAEYMACRQVVIAGDVANLSRRYRAFGLQTYPPGNTDMVIEMIQQQITDPTFCKPDHSLTWEAIAESCLRFIERALSSKET